MSGSLGLVKQYLSIECVHICRNILGPMKTTSPHTNRSSKRPSAAMRWTFSTKHASSESFALTIDVPCVSYLSTYVNALVRSMIPRCDMTRNVAPKFLAYESIKGPVTEGHSREPMILIFGWQRTLHFPDVPVFHAQTVGTWKEQYGKINNRPDRVFTGVTPTNQLLHGLASIYDRF